MRFVATSAIVLLAAVATPAQQPTFKAGTSIVPVLTTVLDGQGRLVPDLEREEFTILDNGKPQEVVFFQNDIQPFTVVVMMDFSFSMNAHLKLLKAAAEQFVLRMLPDDKGQVGAFSDKIMFGGSSFTSDRDDLIAALDDLQALLALLPGSDNDRRIKHWAGGWFNATQWAHNAEMHLRHHLWQKRRIDKYLAKHS